MLSTEEFKPLADDYVLFSHITTRIEGRKHESLLGEKGGGGFPYVVAMNADGDVLAKWGFDFSVDALRDLMTEGVAFESLMAKTDRTPAEEADLFEKRLALNHFSADEAAKKLAGLEVDDETRERLAAQVTDLEIQSHIAKVTSREEYMALAEPFANLYREGKEASGGRLADQFFGLILRHAEATVDPDLYEDALNELKERFDNPRAQAFFERAEQTLADLRAKAEGGGDEGGDDGM